MSSGGAMATKEQAPQVSKASLLAATWSLFGISVLFFVARIIVRLQVSRRLYIDDAWATFALIILLGLSISLTLAIPSMYQLLDVGAGLEMPGATFVSDSSFYLKMQFALTILYWSCLWAVKACFLSFFYRLTTGLRYCRWAWYATVIITALSYIGCVITYPISCSSFVVGHCEAEMNIYRSLVSLRYSTAMDLITDALIIALPLYLAVRVQLPLADKLAISSILSLGVIIMLFAIIRIVVTNQHNTHPETSWLNLWSQIEASVAVIVSSLAPFRAFFTHQKQKSSYSNSNSTPRRNNPSGNMKSAQSGRSVNEIGIALSDHSHAYAEHGTISMIGKADSTERILQPQHILKTVDIEQNADGESGEQ